jgi:hypothetical protein
MKRHAALTSTYTNEINGFDRHDTLTAQSLSKAHRKPFRGVACGVLVAIGIALCIMPYAGSSESVQQKEYIDYKTYSLYLLDFNYKEYKCLLKLYGKESAWNPLAKNGSHNGIPQGRSEWLATQDGWSQVRWGLDYIGNRYGEPCIALDHWSKYGWH